MIRRPCKCGSLPVIGERVHGRIHMLQVQCECGARGVCMMFTKPEDRAKMKQAAEDGWNIAE